MTLGTRSLALAWLLAAGTAAFAAPDRAETPVNAVEVSAPPAVSPPSATAARTDPIMNLLGERGLLRPLDPALVESMRNTVRDTASDLVMQAMHFLGVPYRRGGSSETTGFDCSGFTRHIFENSIGLVLPRRADEQATTAGLLKVQRAELRPGDLVFFNTMRRTFSHVGIYVGDQKFIHAPRPGGEVRIEDMGASYWARRFTGARRADLAAALPALQTSR